MEREDSLYQFFKVLCCGRGYASMNSTVKAEKGDYIVDVAGYFYTNCDFWVLPFQGIHFLFQ
jgi:hypothetical protein